MVFIIKPLFKLISFFNLFNIIGYSYSFSFALFCSLSSLSATMHARVLKHWNGCAYLYFVCSCAFLHLFQILFECQHWAFLCENAFQHLFTLRYKYLNIGIFFIGQGQKIALLFFPTNEKEKEKEKKNIKWKSRK